MVKIRSQGIFPKVDLTILNELVEGALAEWNSLQFRNGAVVHPVTDVGTEFFTLVSGDHRVPGAWYRATMPVLALPDDRVAEFAAREKKLGWSATQAEKDQFYADRAAAMVVSGTRDEVVDIELLVDSDAALEFDLVYGDAGKVNLALDRDAPRAAFTTAIDLSAVAKQAEENPLLRWLLGGRADLVGRLSLDPLLRPVSGSGGSVAGRVNRFVLDGGAQVSERDGVWDVTIDVTLKGKGLGRVATAVAGRKARKLIEHELEKFWTHAETLCLKCQLDSLTSSCN